MWQIRLKSVVQKLSLLSVYLLFLSVQLNLKYTFSDTVFSDYSYQLAGNTKDGINTRSIDKPLDGKPVVQKLRLNKRYVHQDVFLIYTFVEEAVYNFYIKVDETFVPVQRLFNASVCRVLLRGPPRPAAFSC
jgi:hypothetical protein